MTTIDPAAIARSGAVRTRRLTRATAVVAATVINVLLWLGATALGVDFVLSDPAGTAVLGVAPVAAFTLGFALLGWGTLALLERVTRRAATIWTGLAIAVLLLSLVPIFLEEATTGTRIALVVIHVAVAAVLVPALPARGPSHS